MLTQLFRFRESEPLQIHGYQSYGTPNHLYLLGRALEHAGVNLKKNGWWNGLKNAYKQFASDELRYAKLKITLPNQEVIYTTTDAEGYFKIDGKFDGLAKLANSEGWLQTTISFDDEGKNVNIIGDNTFPAEMLIPSPSAEYGVISDVDDTILHTGVASLLKWRVIINTLFKSAASRTSLEGAPELYRKLHRGKSGSAANPMFYVSNSPWNLYNYLEAFISNANFPKGALLLRDFRSPFDKTPKPEMAHKQHEIRNILKTYPDLQFVLIGDSGEHDVDIYLDIAREYPIQIKAVYLRSVKHKKRVLRVRGVLEKYGKTPAVLVEKSKHAEEHARSIGIIK